MARQISITIKIAITITIEVRAHRELCGWPDKFPQQLLVTVAPICPSLNCLVLTWFEEKEETNLFMPRNYLILPPILIPTFPGDLHIVFSKNYFILKLEYTKTEGHSFMLACFKTTIIHI